MRNKLQIIAIVFLCSFTLFAQKKRGFKEAQGYLLYYCIKEEYNSIDHNKNALYNKDYSGSYYVQMTNLPLPVIDSLNTYYKNKIIDYRGIPQERSNDSLATMTCWSCIQLVEAKETKRQLKKWVKMKFF